MTAEEARTLTANATTEETLETVIRSTEKRIQEAAEKQDRYCFISASQFHWNEFPEELIKYLTNNGFECEQDEDHVRYLVVSW